MNFIDLQVNGAFGIDFNGNSLEAPALELACRQLADGNVIQFLPTLITDSIEALVERMERLFHSREQSVLATRMVPGFHVEGPFLSAEAGYIGAHPVQHAKPANLSDMQRVYDASHGLLRMVTLAPERDSQGLVTKWLSDRGVKVSAGHTNASLDELRLAIDNGLSAFTHLGNATPPLMPRHDNIIQRVLALRDHLHIMLIADGHHLPVFMLKNLLDFLDLDRTIVVTDCVSAAGLGPGEYQLAGQRVIVSSDGACRSPDGKHFVGSASTMQQMNDLLENQLHLDSGRRIQLLYQNALDFLTR